MFFMSGCRGRSRNENTSSLLHCQKGIIILAERHNTQTAVITRHALTQLASEEKCLFLEERKIIRSSNTFHRSLEEPYLQLLTGNAIVISRLRDYFCNAYDNIASMFIDNKNKVIRQAGIHILMKVICSADHSDISIIKELNEDLYYKCLSMISDDITLNEKKHGEDFQGAIDKIVKETCCLYQTSDVPTTDCNLLALDTLVDWIYKHKDILLTINEAISLELSRYIAKSMSMPSVFNKTKDFLDGELDRKFFVLVTLHDLRNEAMAFNIKKAAKESEVPIICKVGLNHTQDNRDHYEKILNVKGIPYHSLRSIQTILKEDYDITDLQIIDITDDEFCPNDFIKSVIDAGSVNSNPSLSG